MAIPKSVSNELVAFNIACKEFCESKIILIEKSVSNILKTIAKGGALYSAIAEKIVGYNFGLDFSTVQKSLSFDFIFSEKRVIQFVFYLLNEMDNGHIDSFEFIKYMFGDDSEVAYVNFSRTLIIPFNQAVNGYVQSIFKDKIDDTEKVGQNQNSNNKQPLIDKALKGRIEFVVGEIVDKLKDEKYEKLNDKFGVSTIAVTILVCLSNGEYIGVYGLLLGLKNVLRNKRAFKNDLIELNLIIDTFNKI